MSKVEKPKNQKDLCSTNKSRPTYIEAARKILKMSRAEFEQLTGLDEQALRRWEAKTNKIPVEKAQRIERLLNFDSNLLQEDAPAVISMADGEELTPETFEKWKSRRTSATKEQLTTIVDRASTILRDRVSRWAELPLAEFTQRLSRLALVLEYDTQKHLLEDEKHIILDEGGQRGGTALLDWGALISEVNKYHEDSERLMSQGLRAEMPQYYPLWSELVNADQNRATLVEKKN